jgi:hypothetical protein
MPRALLVLIIIGLLAIFYVMLFKSNEFQYRICTLDEEGSKNICYYSDYVIEEENGCITFNGGGTQLCSNYVVEKQ